MNFDVFISYPHQDKATADAACAALEAEGIRCWIAPRDVAPGAEWAASIVNAINQCRAVVLIFSASANASRQIHREVQQAFDKEKAVVPFRIENVAPEQSLAYYMGPVHWLDALTPPLEQHLKRLTASVKGLLPERAQAFPIANVTTAAPEGREKPPIHTAGLPPTRVGFPNLKAIFAPGDHRISRREFWIGYGTLFLAITVVLQIILIAVHLFYGISPRAAVGESYRGLIAMWAFIILIVSWFPTLILVSKRKHDLSKYQVATERRSFSSTVERWLSAFADYVAACALTVPMMLVWFVIVILQIKIWGIGVLGSDLQPYLFWTFISAIGFCCTAVLGSIRGARGPNVYGPEPHPPATGGSQVDRAANHEPAKERPREAP